MTAVYVAASWNTYRKNRLLILDIIIQCLEKLQEKDAHGRRQAEAKELANDIKASIPFHLDRDYENTTARCHGLKDDIQPGRCLGGLLLMHPLFVASNLSVIPSHMRSQLKECLAWIGEHMGIGQASVFAKVFPRFEPVRMKSLQRFRQLPRFPMSLSFTAMSFSARACLCIQGKQGCASTCGHNRVATSDTCEMISTRVA